MESQNKNNSILLSLIFSTKAMSGKLLLALSPIYYFLQPAPPVNFWERMANISIALFVLAVGIYILYNEYQKKDEYTQEQHEKIIEMAERTAQLAESATRATENSTEAIRNMTSSMERVFNRLDNIDGD